MFTVEPEPINDNDRFKITSDESFHCTEEALAFLFATLTEHIRTLEKKTDLTYIFHAQVNDNKQAMILVL